ncbi:MAG: hypothetical protein ACM3PR_13680, partial [Bacteroidales bacterium]
IRNNSAKVISTIDNEPIATRHQLGKGETLWIPSLLGLGARLGGNEQLARFLAVELKANLRKAPFLFPTLQKGMLMKTLRSGNSYITIIVNKSKDVKEIALTIQNTIRKPELLFADKKGTVKSQFFYILPEETMVVEWK